MCEVNSADVLEILAPIWHSKAETARAVRQRLRSVLEWAVAMEWRSDNPCDRIGPVLGLQGDIVRRMRALPHGEVAAAVETVRTWDPAAAAVRLAFEFLVLTAGRSAEVRLATWDEMDVAGRVWTISAERMKAKREHRVPLGGRSVEILDAARTLGDGDLVFRCGAAGRSRRRRAEDAPAARDRGRCPRLPVVVPGPGGRADTPSAGGHRGGAGAVVPNKVEAAYARSDLFERRRQLMDDWAAYLDKERGQVSPLRR